MSSPNIEGTFARRARHPNQCSGHPPQCFTPKRHSLLRPRLLNPCRLGGPRVGGMAASPLPSRGSPTRGQKMGERGDNWGKIGGKLARRVRRTNVNITRPLPFPAPCCRGFDTWPFRSYPRKGGVHGNGVQTFAVPLCCPNSFTCNSTKHDHAEQRLDSGSHRRESTMGGQPVGQPNAIWALFGYIAGNTPA